MYPYCIIITHPGENCKNRCRSGGGKRQQRGGRALPSIGGGARQRCSGRALPSIRSGEKRQDGRRALAGAERKGSTPRVRSLPPVKSGAKQRAGGQHSAGEKFAAGQERCKAVERRAHLGVDPGRCKVVARWTRLGGCRAEGQHAEGKVFAVDQERRKATGREGSTPRVRSLPPVKSGARRRDGGRALAAARREDSTPRAKSSPPIGRGKAAGRGYAQRGRDDLENGAHGIYT